MAKIAKAGKSAVPTDYRQKTEELAARLERLPNSRFNLLILGAGVVAFLVQAMDTSVIASVLGPLKKILALNPAQTGLISVAAIITTVVGVLLAGPLADLYGRKKILVLGVAIAELFTCLTYFANHYATFLVMRLLSGFGLGFIFPIGLTYISEFIGGKERAYYSGVCNSMLNFGYFMSMLVSYWITPVYGYHAVFLVPGILLLSIPYLIYAVPESPKWLVAHGQVIEAESVVAKIENQVRRWTGRALPPVSHVKLAFEDAGKILDIFSKKYLATTIKLWIMFSMTFVVFYTRLLYMPLILSSQGIDLNHSLLFATIMNFASVPGNILMGILMHVIGRRWTIATYGLLTGLFCIAFSFVTGHVMLIVIGCGIFWFDTFAAQKMLINESYPTGTRGTGAGAAEFVARTIGGILWAGIVPTLLVSWGVHNLFIVIGIASLLLIPMTGLMVRETRTAVL